MASMVDAIRTALRSIGEGEISISAYDTAMVALLKNPDGGDAPQFPSTIDWIIQNQLPDGSWGDEAFFMIRDRIISTLACIVALKSWNIHADRCERGRYLTGSFALLKHLNCFLIQMDIYRSVQT